MKRMELEVEHHFKNRFVGRHRLKPNSGLTVIGSGRDADIRLLGDEVNGVHAAIEFDQDQWVLADLGSERGTWVKKQPIVRKPITTTLQANIGGHHLKIVPKELHSELFSEEDNSMNTQGDQKDPLFHQIVIRKHGFVVDSHLIPPQQKFVYRHGGVDHILDSPSSKNWTKSEFDFVTIQQRLIHSRDFEGSLKEKLSSSVDPSLKKPFLAAAVLIALLSGLFFLAPQFPSDELKSVKMDKNQYSRMIFDAKAVHKRRMESQKVTKNIKGRSKSPGTAKSVSSKIKQTRPSKVSSSKVVNKLKASGLSSLIGKIANRAAKSATFVKASGVRPDQGVSGPSLSQLGGKALSPSGKVGKKFRISGVGTSGKGGGKAGFKGTGGLSVGNVGNASVGILEEETEIQGGLGRDVISRVIESQLGQIRYCYERQLSADPDLYGKVLVKFTIGGTGNVIKQLVRTTTLNNAMVEGCILRRIAGWRFPKPKGGTSVLVTYPFLFKSTN